MVCCIEERIWNTFLAACCTFDFDKRNMKQESSTRRKWEIFFGLWTKLVHHLNFQVKNNCQKKKNTYIFTFTEHVIHNKKKKKKRTWWYYSTFSTIHDVIRSSKWIKSRADSSASPSCLFLLNDWQITRWTLSLLTESYNSRMFLFIAIPKSIIRPRRPSMA